MSYEKQALGMTMQISEDYINNLAREIVTESLLKTLGGGDKFIQQLINSILSTKVDPDNGRPSTYSGAIPYINYLINKIIRDEISLTVAEILEEKRPEIHKVIRKELMKKETVDKFFKAFTDATLQGVDNVWKAKIDITFMDGKEKY